MQRFNWRLRRLAVMSYPEIGHRLVQTARNCLEQAGFRRASNRPDILDRPLPPVWFSLQPPDVDVAAVAAVANELVAGRWRVFAMHDAPLGFPPNWARDPKTGKVAPTATFGKAINYRDEAVVGDIKYLWEINRHLELVTLAQAWHLTGDAKYLSACELLLSDWLAASPYPLGINWISSLELAIRLVNWSVAWHLLGGDKSRLFEGERGAEIKREWLVAIYQHSHFISGYMSLHSSANNHLLGELMGLYVASSVWPVFRESNGWQRLAKQGFEREALVQNGADGVNLEQAVYYQHEVMDMMLICHQVALACGESFSTAYLDRLERMAEFLASVTDVAGNVPMLGDADDALVVRWSAKQGSDPYRSLLATAAVLFNRPDFKAKAGSFDDKSAWLLGPLGSEHWRRLSVSSDRPLRTSFPVGGLYLLGSDLNTRQEIRLLVDCAPLGFLGIAAHGHADALTVTLSAGGEEILVDPGTFSYHTQMRWRNHFRGTAAHNTVRVDGVDQSEIGGPFLWTRKARSELIVHDVHSQPQIFEGRHDGYRRLALPVTHRRRVEYDEVHREITVTDSLDGEGDHDIEICWQFAESLTLQTDGSTVLVRGKLTGAELYCDFPLALKVYRGCNSPIAGWISRQFDVKTPAWYAKWSGRIAAGSSIKTRIRISMQG